MITAYLWLNCGLYALFSIWCTLRPEQTSAFLGLEPKGWKGMSEYVAVYGGLEGGLAVFYGLAATRAQWQEPALWMSACVYLGLVVFRALVGLRSGFDLGTAWGALGLELVMGAAAVVLLTRGA